MSTLIIAVSILSSSFLGSWHCAGMCGPIASLMAQRKGLVWYHLGRLLSYVALGILAGSLGQFFLNSDFIFLRYVSAFLFSFMLIFMGLRWLAPRFALKYMPRIQGHFLFQFLHRIQKFHLNQSAFIVGLLTALLPCGWLYTYVTAAIATRSPFAGAMIMSLFWLGGMPALSALPTMVRKTIQSAPIPQQRVAGGVLILAGLYSVFSFMTLH
ncbi:sulfite exporter TauE/SafE family protein [Bdellovibrio sp. NC01]|uniref:sulfite exporter TauE/SafE family protein n=1 Tax=Bdellovibrio sp. NC01 TaxID=2220073 RepID=UPI00115BE896|nr:sulfite exporter TauE/SafE family protein [Bdellovibrio sp. NC01]QDK38402.1 sulfite exporter TauE/SafE family protein [Bdellovibrio sp. NC01]